MNHYTKKKLDAISLAVIKKGKDIEFEFNGTKHILDIKVYEAYMRYDRPDLFKDKKK